MIRESARSLIRYYTSGGRDFEDVTFANRVFLFVAQICEYPAAGSLRTRLFSAIWGALSKELVERQLDVEEDELMEMLADFERHVFHRACRDELQKNKKSQSDKKEEEDEDELPMEE